jgi:acetyl-CoA carboxylase biotin carboxyl carrier protein
VNLTAADVAEILRLVEDSSFDELSLEFEGLKLSFKRGDGGARGEDGEDGEDGAGESGRSGKAGKSAPRSAAAPPTAAAVADAAPAAAVAADPNSQAVSSPMLGTFYRSPKPGAPPFVAVGTAVEQDTIVGIIEVMKLMNTVRAQVRGTVAEFLAADGALVEYGEVLLRVSKAP